MNESRTKMGEGGRIIIPAAFRRQLNIAVGEELVIRLDSRGLHLFTLKQSLRKAQDLVRHHAKNKKLVKKIKSLRKEDYCDE